MYEPKLRKNTIHGYTIINMNHRRISRHLLGGGAETNVALMTGICLSVFALITIMNICFSHKCPFKQDENELIKLNLNLSPLRGICRSKTSCG